MDTDPWSVHDAGVSTDALEALARRHGWDEVLRMCDDHA